MNFLTNKKYKGTLDNNQIFILALLLVVTVTGIVLTILSMKSEEKQMKDELLSQTVLIEKVLHWREISKFEGSIRDTSNQDYIRLKRQLILLVSGNPGFRFAYFLGRKNNGKIFFYTDSEPVTSKDYSPPGQIYSEAPDEFSKVYSDKNQSIAGPFTDRWGTWVSAIVPLFDDRTKEITAVFVIDKYAGNWESEINKHTLAPISITVSIIILLSGFFFVVRKSKLKNIKLERSQSALKESQEKFQRIVSVIDDIIYTVNAETEEFDYISPAFTKILGYKIEDITTMGGRKAFLSEVIQDKNFNEQENIFKRLKSNELMRGPDWKSWWKCKDGSLVFLEDKWTEVKEGGKLIGTFGVLRDVTVRTKTEDELNKEKLLLQTLMDNIPDYIYFKDSESRFIRVNQAMAYLFGLKSPAEAVGKTDYNFFADEHALAAYCDERVIIESGEPILNKDEKETWPDGSETWASTTKMPLRDSNGEIIGTFGVSRNITQKKIAEDLLKKNERELRELNSMKDKMFSIISHDLKNPFHNILGITTLLAEDYDTFTEEERKDIIIQLKAVTENGYALLENLLTWARSQLNRIQMELDNINIHLLVTGAVYSVIAQAGLKEITIEHDIPKMLTIYADMNFTSTVLRNLLMNAIKFSPRNEKITIAAVDGPDFVTISVKDNGIGIPDEMINKLFHVDSTSKRKGTDGEPGTGLGLLLCLDFIEKMNGKIWAESGTERGTTFLFSLPKKSANKL